MGRKRLNLTGKRFGKLVAREDVGEVGRSRLWLCDCDCGKETKVTSSSLGYGSTVSCGCLQRKRDLTGKRFGKLLAVRSTNKSTSNGILWVCECDCGGSKEVPVGHLTRRNHVKSCGCLRRGRGWVDNV